MDVANEFPSQVAAIYLRSVKHKKKMLRVTSLFKDYKQIPVLLVETSDQAITHARNHGFIK